MELPGGRERRRPKRRLRDVVKEKVWKEEMEEAKGAAKRRSRRR